MTPFTTFSQCSSCSLSLESFQLPRPAQHHLPFRNNIHSLSCVLIPISQQHSTPLRPCASACSSPCVLFSFAPGDAYITLVMKDLPWVLSPLSPSCFHCGLARSLSAKRWRLAGGGWAVALVLVSVRVCGLWMGGGFGGTAHADEYKPSGCEWKRAKSHGPSSMHQRIKLFSFQAVRPIGC